MSGQDRCHCQCCTVRGLTWPVVVITVGVLFLLDRLHGGALYFGNTWPVILVVLGLVHLASAMVSREGHAEPLPQVPAPPAPPGVPPVNPPPSGQGQ